MNYCEATADFRGIGVKDALAVNHITAEKEASVVFSGQ